MKLFDQLEDHWLRQGLLNTEHGATEDKLLAFESNYSVRLPEALRLYFLRLNGMSTQGGHDVDINGFSFLPIAAVQSVAAFSTQMGWIIGDGIQADTSFVFIDYLQWTTAYAFETTGLHSGGIYLLGFERPNLIAPSLDSFIQLYLSNDPALYNPAEEPRQS